MARMQLPARRRLSLLLLPLLLLGGLLSAGPAAATSTGSPPGLDPGWRYWAPGAEVGPRRWGHIDDHAWPPLPGISLYDLVSDPDLIFTSTTGDLTFGGFSADLHGMKPRRLDLYRVVPTEDGFSLITPLSGFFGHNAKLDLGYRVDAADGLLIESVGLSFSDESVFGRHRATADVWGPDDEQPAALEIWRRFCYGREHDIALLDDPAASLRIEEMIKSKMGMFGANWSTNHHFGTTPIPEPASALMLALGLLGLAFSGRPRRTQR